MNSIKSNLEKEKKAIEAEIKSLAKPEDFGDTQDEEADETEEFATHLGIQQVLRNKLESINETLRKIEQGKFGLCERCGKKISWILLRMYPASRLCQKCKKLTKK
ncbi:MAG: hypothetical protein WC475_01235 [Candidatus Paceibacterota bacterium]